jgi:hypothetical protein
LEASEARHVLLRKLARPAAANGVDPHPSNQKIIFSQPCPLVVAIILLFERELQFDSPPLALLRNCRLWANSTVFMHEDIRLEAESSSHAMPLDQQL